jgi:hypothetical protein
MNATRLYITTLKLGRFSAAVAGRGLLRSALAS